jgi:hypothetical protein
MIAMNEIANPYSSQEPTVPSTDTVLSKIAGSREVTEAQGAIMVAKRFPRDEKTVFDRVLVACQRTSLASQAIYSYARGGTDISGASIRLAEQLLRMWGNASAGLRELEGDEEESILEAFAIDYETNVRIVKTFTVKHERRTKKGTFKLDDPRDRYENLANFGARRLRSCILALLPGDLVEAACEQCEQTLLAKADTSPEATKKMVGAFSQFKVTKDQIEKRIQRRIDSITPAQVISLRKVFNSLKDGMSNASDWFDAEVVDEPATKGAAALKEKLKKKPPAEPAPGEKMVCKPPAGCPYTDIGEARKDDCVVLECFQGCVEWNPEPGSSG